LNLADTLNFYGKNKIPIFFTISYDMKTFDIVKLSDMDSTIKYKIDDKNIYTNNIILNTINEDFSIYKNKFDLVIQNIKKGNTYLFNLTVQTKIDNILNLKDIYNNCNAKYKLYYKNKFISFSPETFVKIKNNEISSYPMKGTIDASIKDAKNIILNNEKELAEHTMIVDLIRNDLSMVSNNVKVTKFRYIDKIKAGDKKLFQVSSKIIGELNNDWHENLGTIITKLLPAGSITGTPKQSTIKLINSIEKYPRDYFTGIWGIFDGTCVDTSVIIRYIQNNDGKFVYKSGGGITIDSDCLSEYNEMIDKIYIP